MFAKKGTVICKAQNENPPPPEYNVEERFSQQTHVNAEPVPFFAQLKCIPEIILQLWMWGGRGKLHLNHMFELVFIFANIGP